MVGRAVGYAEGELRADNELRGMSRKQFIDRLAYHHDQLNCVHPFREGNGRTQRVFWNRVARDAAWRAAERVRLSFPTSGATETVRRPQSAPQARTTMHMPGPSIRCPGHDGSGTSR